MTVEPRGWSKARLDNLGLVSRGRSRHRPRNDPSLYGGEYPFVQTSDIKSVDLYLRTFTQTYNEKGLEQSKLWKPETLCITIAANIAETAILKIPACFPDSVVGFTANPKKADVRFVKYSVDFLKLRMQNISRGTTQDNLSVEKLLSFDFLVPALPIQQKIAALLSAYDGLIENNLRRIRILEEMTQSIYREWFVEFRFPGHERTTFVDSPLGRIPQGWEAKGALENSHFTFIDGGIAPYAGTKRYYATADIDGTEIVGAGIEYSYADKPSRAQKEPQLYSVWFARMQDTYKVLPMTDANAELAETCMLSSGFAGLQAIDEDSFPFLFSTINSKEFHAEKDRFCTGATQRSSTNEGLARILTVSPPAQIVHHFGRIARPFINLFLTLQKRNQVLRRTRDLLLPRLICGDLDVSDLDIRLGEDVA